MINWFLDTFSLPDIYKEKANWNTKINEGSIFSPIDNDANDMAEGNKPIELQIFDSKIVVRTWQDLFINFVKYLRDNKAYIFDFILDNQNELFKKEETIIKWSSFQVLIDKSIDLSSRYKNFDGKVWDKVKNLSDDELFIHINISASTCINRISSIMNKFNIDENSVKITLK